MKEKMAGREQESSSRIARLGKLVLDSRHSNKYLAAVILLIATIPRVFYISKGILPNGVDEGIDIMTGRMYDFGYDLYSQVNTVQAPLMTSFYGLIEADPVVFRLFSTLCSLAIIAMILLVGFRIGGSRRPQKAQADGVPPDVVAIFAVVEQADAVASFRQVDPFVCAGLEAGPVPACIAVGGPFDGAPLDFMCSLRYEDVDREGDERQLSQSTMEPGRPSDLLRRGRKEPDVDPDPL